MRAPAMVELAVERALARLLPGWPAVRLCVALSGGVDSVTLLYACHRIRASRPSMTLRAIHVNHGLQPIAGEWPAHCRSVCARLGVPLEIVELGFSPPPGASVEAAARDARYEALRSRLEPGEALLTAHQQDDQLETVLLQLFRGAGVAGLAAMPESAAFGRGTHLRPLLDVSRAVIDAYAQVMGLECVEDPMNRSERFDRGLLRREVTPLLRARWPSVARSVARSARHAANAQQLLDQLAEIDAAKAIHDGRLQAARVQDLPRARQANLLRWWIRRSGLGLPSEARLGALLDDLLPARPGAQPVVTWPSGEVRRHRGWLYAMRPLGAAGAGPWPFVTGQATAIPGVGTLELVPAIGAGFSAPRFPGPFELALRRGGERFRPQGSASEKSVTRWLREAGTEPWLRDRMPLVYSEGSLLAVGDVWIAAGAAAEPDEAGLQVRWTRSLQGARPTPGAQPTT
jgi:tRNA(Ile)-lysidine synthase